jgi:hypothetical protein
VVDFAPEVLENRNAKSESVKKNFTKIKGGFAMGGRGGGGGDVVIFDKHKKRDPWDWIKDVSTRRLIGYSKRAQSLRGKGDPQGRNIHTVGYYAEQELAERFMKR